MAEICRNIRCIKEGNTVVVSLRGRLTANHMIELYETTMTVLSDTDRLIIDAREASGLPVSAFQVFCHGFREAKRKGKRFEVTGPLPEPLGNIVRVAGLRSGVECRLCPGTGCLWAGRGNASMSEDVLDLPSTEN